jgi:hypothetical protein
MVSVNAVRRVSHADDPSKSYRSAVVHTALLHCLSTFIFVPCTSCIYPRAWLNRNPVSLYRNRPRPTSVLLSFVQPLKLYNPKYYQFSAYLPSREIMLSLRIVHSSHTTLLPPTPDLKTHLNHLDSVPRSLIFDTPVRDIQSATYIAYAVLNSKCVHVEA